MPNRHSASHDVVIAGAGPVGLFLASELRLAGASVLVLEKADDPASPLKQLPFGMRGLSAPTLDAFYRRGILDDLVAAQQAHDPAGVRSETSAHWRQQARRPAGHFAGIPFFQDNIDSLQWPYRLPTPAGTHMAVDMQTLETVLAARAAALGVEIRRGLGVDSLIPSDEGVRIGAASETFHGCWVVGCDGGRSTVRKLGDFAFTGTDPEFTGYSVEVVLDDPGKLTVGRSYTPTGMYTFAKPGTVAMVDFDGGAFHRSQPVTPEHVEAVLRRVSGADVSVTGLRMAATWTDRAYQARTYRNGRILLAGDAAHTHSPLGGQGLNLGIGDAMNLGWKLASVIRGDAPEGLLDSYTAERHPVGAQVLDWSRAQVGIMRPSHSSRALAGIIRDLVETHDGATYFAERVWGVSLRYDLGHAHPLVGRGVPDFELPDGTKLGTQLGSIRGLILDFEASPQLEAFAGGWKDRITYLAVKPKNDLGLSAALVRPDGVVAWVAEAGHSQEGLETAVSQWFGARMPCPRKKS